MKRGNACGDQDVKRWGSRAGQGWPEERSEGFLEGRGRAAPFASAALERAAALVLADRPPACLCFPLNFFLPISLSFSRAGVIGSITRNVIFLKMAKVILAL